MPTPTLAGQYREVKYADDGCTVYQCLWCLGTVEVRDNPEYGWNFCPKCGKSWFNQKRCRTTHTPRWYWDRYGEPNDSEHEVVLTTGETVDPYDCRWGRGQKITREWVIESRHKISWATAEDGTPRWSNWDRARSVDYKSREVSNWKQAAYHLRMLRMHDWDGPDTEYRVTIVDK